MKYVSKNRTHNKKVWATILVISMMLQFFLPFTGPLNAVPVRAEETSERMTSPASIEALDLSDEVISRPKTESPSVGDIVDAQPVQVGPFKNVKHKLSIADHQENSCRRVLKGELEFDWPEPSTYVDVVFVQDFSGSFKSIDPSIPDPIISIGNAVHEMLDGLSIGQDFNGYPKDRVMFVGFQGSQGTAEISNYYSYGDLIKTSTADASYKIRKSNLMNSRSQMNTWIKNHYYADIVKGGTPTVDGMGEAYDHYRSQVINTAGQPIHPYDRETYYVTDNEGNLLERKRKTIYVLITDGAANNAKWKYLSEGARKKLTRNPSGFAGNQNTSFHWNDYRQRPSDPQNYLSEVLWYPAGYWINIYDSNYSSKIPSNDKFYTSYYGTPNRDVFHEAFQAMLIGVRDIADRMRGDDPTRPAGGINGTPATVLAAFWEDYDNNNEYFGREAKTSPNGNPINQPAGQRNWDIMKPIIDDYMYDVVGQNNKEHYITSQDMSVFTKNLVKVFKKATVERFDSIQVEPRSNYTVGDTTKNDTVYVLQRFNEETNDWVNVKPGDATSASTYSNLLEIDMDQLTKGKYRLTYYITEKKFLDSDQTDPVNIRMRFEDEEHDILPSEQFPEIKISGNPLDSCSYTVEKWVRHFPDLNIDVLPEDPTFGADHESITADKLGDQFTFVLDYFISDEIANYNNPVATKRGHANLYDQVDSRVDIKKVRLKIFKAATASSLEVNKEIEIPANYIDYVTNEINYPLSPVGAELNLTAEQLAGSNAYLIINGKLKDGLDKTQIKEIVYGTPEVAKGIPNQGYIKYQAPQFPDDPQQPDEDSIPSNIVHVYFPDIPMPKQGEIRKSVNEPTTDIASRTLDTNEWLSLAKQQDPFEYRLMVTMPDDIFGYRDFKIVDDLDAAHQDLMLDQIKLHVFDTTAQPSDRPNEIKLEPHSYENNQYGFIASSTVKQDDPSIEILTLTGINLHLSDYAGKTLMFVIPAKLRGDFDLTANGYMNFETDPPRIRVPNRFKLELFTTDYNRINSNYVHVEVPLQQLTIKKVDDQKQPLAGATFTFKDVTPGNNGTPKKLSPQEGEENTFVTPKLIPGHTYVITETEPPVGYQRPQVNELQVEVKNDGSYEFTPTISEAAQNGIEIDQNILTSTFINRPSEPVTIKKFIENKRDEAGEPLHQKADANDAFLLEHTRDPIHYALEIAIPENVDGIKKILIRDDELPRYYKLIPYEPAVPNHRFVVIRNKTTQEVYDDIFYDERERKILINDPNQIRDLAGVTLEVDFTIQRDTNITDEVFFNYYNSDRVNRLIKNRAMLQVNDGETQNSNPVYATYKLGQFTFKKQLSDETGTQITNLSENQTAVFRLFEKVGDVIDPAKDRVVTEVLVTGSNNPQEIATKVIKNLEPGHYYLMETSAPQGYLEHDGIIPETGFEITPDQLEVNLEASIINKRAEIPTVEKFVGPKQSQPIDENYMENNGIKDKEYGIELDEIYWYRITVTLPERPASKRGDVVLTDQLKKDLRFATGEDGGVAIHVCNAPEGDKLFELAGREITGWLDINELTRRNKVVFTIPDEKYDSMAGKMISITFATRVKEGKFFTEDDYTDANPPGDLIHGDKDRLPNTVVLTWDGGSDDDTAYVIPRTVMDLEFVKVDGNGEGIQDVKFNLYRVNPDNIDEFWDANDQPTNEAGAKVMGPIYSDAKGVVSFKEIKDGVYLLKEVGHPAQYFPQDGRYYVRIPNDRQKTPIITFKPFDTQSGIGNVVEDTTTVDGKTLTAIWNNEKRSIRGQKFWEDNNDPRRPQTIIVLLKRSVNGVVDPDFEAKVEASAPTYVYSFTDLDKYSQYKVPYVYEISEIGDLDDYIVTTSEDGYDLTNALKTTKLTFKKLDAETQKALPGVIFHLEKMLSDGSGYYFIKEIETDAKGNLNLENLSAGTYRLRELSSDANADYIVKTYHAYFRISYEDSETPKIKVWDTNETNEIFAITDETSVYYPIKNDKLPPLEKQIKLADGTWSHANELKQLNQEITYRLKVTFGPDVSDYETVRITDILPKGMQYLGVGNYRIYYENSIPDNENPVADYTTLYDSTEEKLQIAFELDPQHKHHLANNIGYIEFKTYMSINVDDFQEEYGESPIINHATMIINELPHNEIRSNDVKSRIYFSKVKFKKTLEKLPAGLNSGVIWNQSDYEFRLYREGAQKPLQIITDSENQTIVFENLEIGKYYIKEAKAPTHYVPMQDIHFEVYNDDNGQRQVRVTQPDGINVESEEGTYVFVFDDIKNKLPEKPIISKYIQEAGSNQSPTDKDKAYVMPNRKAQFDYTIRTAIKDVRGYRELVIEDPFPVDVEIADQTVTMSIEGYEDSVQKLIVKDGTETGSLSLDNQILNYRYVFKTESIGTAKRFVLQVIFDAPTAEALKPLANKTIVLKATAGLSEEAQKRPDFDDYSEDGWIPNTARVLVNELERDKDTVKVKPSPKFGVKLKKVVRVGTDKKYPAYDAIFKLSRIDDGPELPDDFNSSFISNKQGLITIPKALDVGSYLLSEITTPEGYIDNNDDVSGDFAYQYKTYTLTIKEDGQHTLTPIKNNPTDEDVIHLYEDSLEIVNLPLTEIKVKKEWDDENNKFSTRPEKVTVKIRREKLVEGKYQPDDGFNQAFDEQVGAIEIPKDGTIRTIRTLLSDPDSSPELLLLQYDSNGNPYRYAVVENQVSDLYTSAVTEQNGVWIVTNTMKSAKLKLVKTGEPEVGDSYPKKLQGIEFTVRRYDQAGNITLERVLTTDGEGIIDFNLDARLAPGYDYTLFESKIPDEYGYVLDDTLYYIVVDENSDVTVYENSYDPEHPEANKSKKLTVSDEDGTKQYTLKIHNVKPDVPDPTKTVNQKKEEQLGRLDEVFTFRVSVPVESINGMKEFVIEDELDQYLDLTKTEDITVLADSVSIVDDDAGKIEWTPAGENQKAKVKFTLTKNFEKIANRTVVLTFKAKIKEGVPLDTLLELSQQQSYASGIPNEAKVSFNDKSKTSNKVHIIPGEKGPVPTLSKTVNKKDYYELIHREEVVTYDVRVDVPKNVLGYDSLSIHDTLDPALEAQGAYTVRIVRFGDTGEQESEMLDPQKDYELTTSGGHINVKMRDGFDYSRLAGNSLILTFDAKIKSRLEKDGKEVDFETFFDSYKDQNDNNRIKIPNEAELLFNGESIEKAKVHIEPPQKPIIHKKVNNKDELTADENILSKPLLYSIEVEVPINMAGVLKFVIKDELKEVFLPLDETRVNFYVKDQDTFKLLENYNNDHQTNQLAKPSIQVGSSKPKLEVTIKGNANLLKYAGKTIKVTFEAKLDPQKDISNYLVDGNLDNTAQVKIDDRPGAEDDARVKVHNGTIEIIKQSMVDQAVKLLPEGTSATFELYTADNNASIGKFATAKQDGLDRITVAGLLPGEYYFKEVEAPENHVFNKDQKDRKYRFIVKADGTISLPDGVEGDTFTAAKEGVFARFTIDNELIGETTIKVKKNWIDNDNTEGLRPARLTFKVTQYKGDNATEPSWVRDFNVEVPAKGTHQTYTIPNNSTNPEVKLPAKDKDGTSFTYKVEEVKPANYKQEVVEPPTDGANFEFKNTLEGTITIPWQKVWEGGDPTNRPAITITLQADGEDLTKPAPIDIAGGPADDTKYSGSFENLPRYKDGKKITYTIKETIENNGKVTNGTYTSSFNSCCDNVQNPECGILITNKFVPTKGKLRIEKTWVGKNPDVDEVKFELTRKITGGNKEFVKEITVKNNEGKWIYESQEAEFELYDQNGQKYTYFLTELNVPEKYAVIIDNAQVTEFDIAFDVKNTYNPDTTSVRAVKKWKGGVLTERPAVYFKLRAKVEGKYLSDDALKKLMPDNDQEIVKKLGTEDSVEWLNLKETDANGNSVTYEVREVMPDPKNKGQYVAWEHEDYTTDKPIVTNGIYTFTNTYKVEQIQVKVDKKWPDQKNHPASVEVKLIQSQTGTVETVIGTITLDAKNSWKHTWENIAKTDANGTPYLYKVVETVPEGYTASYTPEGVLNATTATIADGDTTKSLAFIITNAYTPNTTTVTAKKKWVGGNQTERPAVYFELRAKVEGKYLSNDALKKLMPGNDQEIVKKLGTEDSVEWLNLKETDANGNSVTYEVQEVMPDPKNKGQYVAWEHEDYTTDKPIVTNGIYTFTNTYKVEQIQVKVDKKWSDQKNHPASVEVKLIQSQTGTVETVIGTITLDAKNSWKHTWENIAKTDANGTPYLYKVVETVPEGYTASYTPEGVLNATTATIADGDTTKSLAFIITNAYTPNTTTVTAKKKWVGGNQTERPAVYFELRAKVAGQTDYLDETALKQLMPEDNKNIVKQLTDGSSGVEWLNLKETDANGNSVTYEVREVMPNPQNTEQYVAWEHPHYTSEYNPDTNTFVNTYAPELTSLKIKKIWQDDNNAAGKRPQSLTFKLTRKSSDQTVDPITTEHSFTVSLSNEQEFVIDGLLKKDGQGKDYTYIVEEVTPDGYDSVRADVAPDGYAAQFTNTYSPGMTSITAKKVWDGGDENNRPAVYFKLRAKVAGQTDYLDETALKKLMPENNKDIIRKLENNEVVWNNLKASTTDGKTVTYSVEEVNEDGASWKADQYTTTGPVIEDNTFTFTNTYTSDTIDIHINKTWENDTFADRPSHISFKLKRTLNGAEAVTTIHTFETNETSFTISDLPRTDTQTGTAYTYEVDEIVPAGYEKSGPIGSGTIDAPYTFTNTLIQKPQITIKKVDDSEEPKPLENAYFELRSDTHVVVMKSDGNGEANFKDLPDGVYTLKELRAPDTYEAIPGTLATITIADHKIKPIGTPPEGIAVEGNATDKALTLQVTNKKKTTELILWKVNDEKIPLNGVTFNLKRGDDVIGSFTTQDPDGKVTITGLSPGTYTLQEAGTVPGYFPNNAKYTITVTDDLQVKVDGKRVQDFTVVNRKEDDNLIVIKLDADTKQALEGAVFALYKKAVETEAKTKTISVKLVRNPEGLDITSANIQVTLNGKQDGEIDFAKIETKTLAEGDTLTFDNIDSVYVEFEVSVTAAAGYQVQVVSGEGNTFIVTVSADTTSGDTPTAFGLTVNELQTQYNETLEIQNQAIEDYNELIDQINTLSQELNGLNSGDGGGSNETPSSTGTNETTETTTEETTATTSTEMTESTTTESTTEATTTTETTTETSVAETEPAEDQDLAEKQNRYNTLVQKAEAQKQAIDERQTELDAMKAELDTQVTVDEPTVAVSDPKRIEIETNETQPRSHMIVLQSNNIAPEGYNLIKEGLATGEDGTVKLPGDLESGAYKLVETQPPQGYLDEDYEIDFMVERDETTGYKTYKVNDQITTHLVVENKREITWRDLTITKRWHDLDEQRISWPEGYSLEFTLYQNGVPYVLTTESLPTGATATIKGGILQVTKASMTETQDADGAVYEIMIRVPEKDINGNAYTYSATEVINAPDTPSPYFYYPKEWKVEESASTHRIEFYNMDPYKFINITIEKMWDVADDKLEKLPSSLSFEIQRSTDQTKWETVESVFLSKADAVSDKVWRKELEKNYPGHPQNANNYNGESYTYRVVEIGSESYKQTAATAGNEGHVFTFSFTNELVEEPEPTPPEPTEPEPTPPRPTDPPPRVPNITVPPRPTIPKQKEASPGVITTPIPATGETRTLFPLLGLALMLAFVYLRKQKRG